MPQLLVKPFPAKRAVKKTVVFFPKRAMLF